MKRQSFVIKHGSYPFDVYIAIGLEDDEVFGELEKLGIELDDEAKVGLKLEGVGRSMMLSGGASVLRLRLTKDKHEFIANLSHEVFHCVEFLFDRVGLKYHIDSGEAWAYQIQHLTEQVVRRMKWS